MYPHRIRLRGPWAYEPLVWADGRSDSLPPSGSMNIPCRWGDGGLGSFAGHVRFRRRFAWPGRLDAHERVWLTFTSITGTAQVWLNDRFLAKLDRPAWPFEVDVTSFLQVSNHLAVEVEGTGDQAGLCGEVALEVRCTAFLQSLRWWVQSAEQTAQLHIAGELVGVSDRSLELYALWDGKTVIYATLEPSPTGTPFHLTSRDISDRRRDVRIELVNGASIWYAAEGVV
jgi:hypothetical protein